MRLRLLDLLCPRLYAESLAGVDLDALAERGIEAILLDLDNTILPWRDSEVPEESAKWVREALDRGMRLCIASNTRNPRRLKLVAGKLGIPCLDKIAKPRRKGLRQAIHIVGSDASRTAVIGDQIFTDILGGNRLRMFTILVRPMHHREFIGTKISRLLEKPVIAWLKRKGLVGTKAFKEASEIQD
ncbi:MAG: YqeG family HAD IIIA-type phosphatase [Armatimonadetes bacterium]|nr:YqeG family HAD IIIA-type phosphatase [Armatimonadota bacterium]